MTSYYAAPTGCILVAKLIELDVLRIFSCVCRSTGFRADEVHHSVIGVKLYGKPL
jgi:hypothetical protein